MSEVILELRSISYAYEEGQVRALDDLSVAIGPGERVAVLGNNGAGKSTFFLCCNGVLRQSGGEILYRGRSLTRSRSDLLELRKKVGLVFQDPDHQMIASTVESEISFGPMNLRLPADEVARRVEDALSAMDLTSRRERPPHYLSGGEKKRVSIADILAMRPEIILFDEPTASLDPRNTALLEQTLADLHRRGMSILLSTHDIDFAWRWAERLLIFSEGRLLADGPPAELFADGALLDTAGLRRPILYEAAEALFRALGRPAPASPPRDLEEFRQLLSVCQPL